MPDNQFSPLADWSELDLLALRLGVAQVNREQAEETEKTLREQAVKAWGEGGKRSTLNPLNPKDKLWHCTASETKYRAQVTDRSATEEWVKENYPLKARKRMRIVPGTSMDEIVQAVINSGATYLVEEVVEVEDHVLRELELKAQQAREPIGFGGEIGADAPPGISVTKPASKMLVTFQPGGREMVAELMLAGVIDAEGNPIRRAGRGSAA